MKKHGWAVLALAAVMSLGTAGITAMAATGWVQEGNNWAYYSAGGNRKYNDWERGNDGLWRYLNGNGVMALDTWVDGDDYYVDANGIMVAGKWLQVTNADSPSGYDWYYFNSTGKCMKEQWEQINGSWYYFDGNGVMQTGWILDDMYYCNENGVMQTGWQKLYRPDEDDYEEEHNGPFDTSDDDGRYWFYFGTNGKKTVPDDDDDNFKQKRINGVYYCLAEDGAMLTGWVCVTGDDSDNIEDYRFVDENGQVRTGWYSAEPPENLQSQYEHDVEWFYFNNKGIPKVGPDKGTATTKDLEKIGGNTYLFGTNGVPVYGLQKVYIGSNEETYTSYYFGTKEQSSMLKGKFHLDDSGERRQYYFTNTGRGYTGVHDNYLYYMGRLQKAESGSRYEVITIDNNNYVVNSSGRIARNTTVKDSDGVKYKVNSSGILLEEDGEIADNRTYSSPEEPDWDYWD